MTSFANAKDGGPGRVPLDCARPARLLGAGFSPYLLIYRAKLDGGPGRVRTYEGARPADLQSAPFDRFGTDPLAKG